MIRGVILDYGSTLITFDGDVTVVRARAHRAMLDTLCGAGVTLRERSFLRRLAGKFTAYDRKRAIDNLETTALSVLTSVLEEEKVPPQPITILRRALRSMYEVYEAHWILFPDSIAALEKIRAAGLRMAMLSNASDEENVRRMLDNHKLKYFFDPVVISAAIGIRKPDRRAFQPILGAWGIPAGQLVMVGDRLEADILGGKQAGMRTIWLTTEIHAPANRKLRGKIAPDAQVKTIGEAAALLVHWKDQPQP
ncbi:MAG: HAD family hydrolase [Anaerolineales bacterium]|nr:HAD family hydrolase [Anaerolineales bacterium]